MTAPDRNAAWDGLRAVAVVGVLVYHVEGHPLSGGFLGVSLFFTLSGFLITSLLVDRLERAARLDFADFWARRFRRLLPAMLATTVLCQLFAWFAASANQRDALPWDAVSAVTGWSNWRFLLTGQEYGGAALVPSPLLHTWSLSIELQAYLVVPVVLLGAWRVGGRRAAAWVLGACTLASVITGLVVASDPQQWYLGTHVRVAEILIGATAAVVLRGTTRTAAERLTRPLVPVALVLLGVMWWTATTSDTWLVRGGFVVHAVATLVLVLGASGGWFTTVMALRPLVGLGRISYGVYLYHWPIYLWLDPRRLGMDRWPTTAVRVAVTLLLAVVSYRLVEARVLARRGGRRRTVSVAIAAMATTSVLVLAVSPAGQASDRVSITDGLVAPPRAPTAAPRTTPPTTTLAPSNTPTAEIPEDGFDEEPTATPPPPEARFIPPLTTTGTSAGEPPTILMVGDSALATLGMGVQSWASFLGNAEVYVSGWMACPVTIGGDIRWNDGVIATPDAGCEWRTTRDQELRQVDPDVVVMMTGIWEIVDRRLPGRSDWIHIGHPEMDALVRASLAELTDLMGSTGATLVWLLSPDVKNSIYARVPGPLPEEDPARMARLNELIREVAAERPGVWVLDLPAVLEDRYGDRLALVNRVDGFHWSDAGREVDAAWLTPLLVEVAAAGPAPPAPPP